MLERIKSFVAKKGVRGMANKQVKRVMQRELGNDVGGVVATNAIEMLFAVLTTTACVVVEHAVTALLEKQEEESDDEEIEDEE